MYVTAVVWLQHVSCNFFYMKKRFVVLDQYLSKYNKTRLTRPRLRSSPAYDVTLNKHLNCPVCSTLHVALSIRPRVRNFPPEKHEFFTRSNTLPHQNLNFQKFSFCFQNTALKRRCQFSRVNVQGHFRTWVWHSRMTQPRARRCFFPPAMRDRNQSAPSLSPSIGPHFASSHAAVKVV